MRKVDAFPVVPSEYPSQFSEIFDGNIWEVTLKDYPTYNTLKSLAGGMRVMARSKGMTLTIRTVGDKLYVQANN